MKLHGPKPAWTLRRMHNDCTLDEMHLLQNRKVLQVTHRCIRTGQPTHDRLHKSAETTHLYMFIIPTARLPYSSACCKILILALHVSVQTLLPNLSSTALYIHHTTAPCSMAAHYLATQYWSQYGMESYLPLIPHSWLHISISPRFS